jgi:hypothetical protein
VIKRLFPTFIAKSMPLNVAKHAAEVEASNEEFKSRFQALRNTIHHLKCNSQICRVVKKLNHNFRMCPSLLEFCEVFLLQNNSFHFV